MTQCQLCNKGLLEAERDYWSGKITLEEYSDQYGESKEVAVQHLLFHTTIGQLLQKNLHEFKSDLNKIIKAQVELLPKYLSEPLDYLHSILRELMQQYKNESNLDNQLKIVRELRQVAEILLKHSKGEVKDKQEAESGITMLRSKYLKVFT